MKFYECSFIKRIVIPALFFLLPISAHLNGAATKDIAILVAVAVIVSSSVSAIFGKRININSRSKEVLIEQTTLGISFSRKSFALSNFDHISVHRERVYSTSLPVPAHKGAIICSLARGDFNLVIKSESSEERIGKVAGRLKDLTGLPIKHAGEVLD